VGVLATLSFPEHVTRRSIGVLSVLAHTLLEAPEQLADVAQRVSPLADLDAALVLRGAQQVQQELQAALARNP
jgi:hypothetical protein